MNHRSFTRLALNHPATLKAVGMDELPCQIEDFCKGGLFVTLEPRKSDKLSAGSKVSLFFQSGKPLNLKYRLETRVMRVDFGSLGLKIEQDNPEAVHALYQIAQQQPKMETPAIQAIESDQLFPYEQALTRYLQLAAPVLVKQLSALQQHPLYLQGESVTQEQLHQLGQQAQARVENFVQLSNQQLTGWSERKGNLLENSAETSSADLENWLMIRGTATASERRWSELLALLAEQMNQLIAGSIKNSNNPLGPTCLCHAFHQSLIGLKLSRELVVACFEIFSALVLEHLDTLYLLLLEPDQQLDQSMASVFVDPAEEASADIETEVPEDTPFSYYLVDQTLQPNNGVQQPTLFRMMLPLLVSLEEQEPDYYRNDRHPLLNCLESLLMLDRLMGQQSVPVLQKLLPAVVKMDIARDALIHLHDELHNILTNSQSKRQRQIDRLTASQQGAERIAEAKQQVAQLIHDSIKSPWVPAVLIKVLDAGWRNLLVNNLLKLGREDQTVRGYAYLVKALGQISPHSTPDQSILKRSQPLLELVSSTCEQEHLDAIKRLLPELRQALLPQPGQRQLDYVQVDLEQLLPAGFDPNGLLPEARNSIDFPLQQWFFVSENLQPVQLVWISEKGTQCLLVNASGQSWACWNSTELQQALKNNQLIPDPFSGLERVRYWIRQGQEGFNQQHDLSVNLAAINE